MKSRVYTRNVESLADFLVDLNLQFYIDSSKEFDAAVINKYGHESYGIVKNISIGKLKPILKIILDDTVAEIRVIIPECNVEITYLKTSGEVKYNFCLKQKCEITHLELVRHIGGFDVAEEVIESFLEDLIETSINNIFKGEVFDNKKYYKIKGFPNIRLANEYFINKEN